MTRPLTSTCPCGGRRVTTFPKVTHGTAAWWRCLSCGARTRRAR